MSDMNLPVRPVDRLGVLKLGPKHLAYVGWDIETGVLLLSVPAGAVREGYVTIMPDPPEEEEPGGPDLLVIPGGFK